MRIRTWIVPKRYWISYVNKITSTIKAIRLANISKSIHRQSRPIHRSMIPIPALIIGVAIEGVPRHEAVGGEVGGEGLGKKG